jgi:hypothetical protein
MSERCLPTGPGAWFQSPCAHITSEHCAKPVVLGVEFTFVLEAMITVESTVLSHCSAGS